MPEISRARALAYALVLLAVLAVAGRFALGEGKGTSAPDVQPAPLLAEKEPERKVVVHVAGAVARPGLYRLADGSRIDDAIARAGGAKSNAALDLVNLAAPVVDGQQVLVPRRGSAGVALPGGGTPGGGTTPTVHLNTATLEQFDTLPGIGPVTAQKILDYRAENGPFRSVDELDAVSGIGPARLEELRPLVDL
jgi:competence protein ComEA